MRQIRRRSRRKRNSKAASSGGRGKTDVSPALVKLFETLNSSRETDEDDTEHDTKTREKNKILSVLSAVDISIFKPKPPAAQTPKNVGVSAELAAGFYRCQLPQEDLNCLATTITIIGNPPSGPGSVPGTNNGFVSADGVIVLTFNHDWCIDTMVYNCPNYNDDTSVFSISIFPFSADNPPILATSNMNRRLLQDLKEENPKSRKLGKRGKGRGYRSPPRRSPPRRSPPPPSPSPPSPSPPSPSPPNPSPPNLSPTPSPPRPTNPNGTTKITITLPHGHVSCQTRCPMPGETGGSLFPPGGWSPAQNVGFNTIGFGPLPNPNFGTANLGNILLPETHPDCQKTVFMCQTNTEEGGNTMYFKNANVFSQCVRKVNGPGSATIIYPPNPNPPNSNPPNPNPPSPNPWVPNPPPSNPWGSSSSSHGLKSGKSGKDRRMLGNKHFNGRGSNFIGSRTVYDTTYKVIKTAVRVPMFGLGSVPVGSSVVTVGLVSWVACPSLDCANRGQYGIFMLPMENPLCEPLPPVDDCNTMILPDFLQNPSSPSASGPLPAGTSPTTPIVSPSGGKRVKRGQKAPVTTTTSFPPPTPSVNNPFFNSPETSYSDPSQCPTFAPTTQPSNKVGSTNPPTSKPITPSTSPPTSPQTSPPTSSPVVGPTNPPMSPPTSPPVSSNESANESANESTNEFSHESANESTGGWTHESSNESTNYSTNYSTN
eukprot:scaffold36411_cov60-Attheya_sp.AAC.1